MEEKQNSELQEMQLAQQNATNNELLRLLNQAKRINNNPNSSSREIKRSIRELNNFANDNDIKKGV